MFTIRTKHVSNVNGRGQVRATGGGRQRTVSWDHAVSAYMNHAEAISRLIAEAFPDEVATVLLRRNQWEHTDNGDTHVWKV